MDETPRAAAIYTRISKDRTGESLGVQRQEEECRKLADRLGATVVAVHSDNDISAFSGKRAARITNGCWWIPPRPARIDTLLIAWHTDRHLPQHEGSRAG